MKKLLMVSTVLILGYAVPSFAQAPCYSAAECGAIRQQAQAAQQAQADAYARQQRQAAREAEANRQQVAASIASARLAQEARTRQAAIDYANAQVAQDARNRQAAIDRATAQAAQEVAMATARRQGEAAASAELAAEQSPNNHCHDAKFAGKLISDFNLLQATKDFNLLAVDIDHLVTVNYNADNLGVYVCHGAFVLQNGRRITGSMSSRLNVAGTPLVSFNQD